MKKAWLVAAAVVFLLPLGLARAAEFASNSNGDIVVASTETHHNLYTAGMNVTIDANTSGDLTAAGQTVVINGNVENSLLAAGQTVNIRGNIGNSARLAGSAITITGNINGDLLVAGSDVTISKDATISGGIYAAGSTITLKGTVKGEARIAGGELILSGSTGPVTAYGDLTVKKTAVIKGDLKYQATQPASIEDGATITGKTDFTKRAQRTNDFAAALTLTALASTIGWILFGLLFAYLLPKKSQAAIDTAVKTPLASIGYGLAVLLLGPIFAFVLAISIIGLPISALLILAWLLVLVLGIFLGKIVLGALIYRLFVKDQPLAVNWKTIIIGVIAATALGLLPILGGLIKFVLLVLGIGAVCQVVFTNNRDETSATVH